MRTSRTTAAVVLLALATGCGTAPRQPAPVAHPYRIPTSQVDVPRTGVSWMQGTTLHVDGRAVDTGVRAESYALLPDGVLLYRQGVLSFSDTRGRATGVASGVVGPDGVQVSPDGHHVAFLDGVRGPTDETGDHFLRLDVLDTRTGEQVLASVKGMGDLDDDVAEQYEEFDPELIGLDDEAAYVKGVDAAWRYPYDGGAPRHAKDAEIPYGEHGGLAAGVRRTHGGFRLSDRPGSAQGTISPTRTTGLYDTLNYTFAPFVVDTGRPLALSLPPGSNKFAVGGWLAGGDFWGFAFRGRSAAVIGSGRMVTCSVSRLVCTPDSGRLSATDQHPLLVGGASGLT